MSLSMKDMPQVIKDFFSNVGDNLMKAPSFLDKDAHPFVVMFLYIFFIMYASFLAPKLPPFMIKLFENKIFRILMIALIIYIGIKDPVMAIIMAVGFVITIQSLNCQSLKGQFTDIVSDIPLIQKVPYIGKLIKKEGFQDGKKETVVEIVKVAEVVPAEAPKVEPPKEEVKVVEAPKVEAPKIEQPKEEVKAIEVVEDVLKLDTIGKEEPPKVEKPKVEVKQVCPEVKPCVCPECQKVSIELRKMQVSDVEPSASSSQSSQPAPFINKIILPKGISQEVLAPEIFDSAGPSVGCKPEFHRQYVAPAIAAFDANDSLARL